MSLAHAQFRQALVDGDVNALLAIWARVMPHLPQPETREAAAAVMHRARTEATSVPFRARAYSHRWLEDRGLPSGLPDRLKPRAEQICPRVVAGVGIAVESSSPILKPVAKACERAMSDAVAELHADGVSLESPLIRQRMKEAHQRTLKELLGTTIVAGRALPINGHN